MRSRSSNVVERPLHIDKSGIKKWDLAENYQARAFRQVRDLKLPESIPRYRYNYIDMILSIWVYRYRYIDRLLSNMCSLIWRWRALIMADKKVIKKIKKFAKKVLTRWLFRYIIRASRWEREGENNRDAPQMSICMYLDNSIYKSLFLPYMPFMELWEYNRRAGHGCNGNTIMTK